MATGLHGDNETIKKVNFEYISDLIANIECN